MKTAEMLSLMEYLEEVFEVVRLVDASSSALYVPDGAGGLTQTPYRCFATWKKPTRCEHCVSAKAMACRGTRSKFEFVDDQIYYVISRYIELEGVPMAMELVSHVSEETLMDAHGRNRFIQTISDYNRKLFLDSLTGAHNRRYFDEQLQYLPGQTALAMVDMDNFKSINDTFGHPAGDLALRSVVQVIQRFIRDADVVVRYGGDEFLLVLHNIPTPVFAHKLELIRQGIQDLTFPQYPGLLLTVSIGAICGGGPIRQALEAVDSCLYRAKTAKNTVVIE